IGPAVGGALIYLTGEALSSYLVAATFQFLFVGLLATLPSVAPPPPASGRARSRKTLADIFGGFAFMRRTPACLGATTPDLFAVLLGGAVALMPVYAKDVLEV